MSDSSETISVPAKVDAPARFGHAPSYWVIALIVVLAALPYLQTAQYAFVNYDDGLYVTEEPMVLQGLSGEGFVWAFTTFKGGNWHPMTWLSHMTDVTLWGEWAGGHHLVNVLIHAINACLVYVIFVAMTGASWRSAFVAAIFAVHPLRVESVAWVAERKDVLAAFFGLLAIFWYVRFIAAPTAGRYVAVLALMTLSLMCKPMLVTLPCILLLLDWWPLGRLAGRIKSAVVKRAVLEKMPMFGIAAVFSYIAVLSQSAGANIAAFDTLSLPQRVSNAAVAYGTYLQKTIAPVNLAVFYPHPGHWPNGIVAIYAFVLAAISIVALWQWRAKPWLAIGWLFFLGVLVPVIGLVQIGTQSMADRYTYIPSLGLVVMVVWSIPHFENRVLRRAAVAMGCCIVLVLLITSHVQASHWRDSEALFAHAARVTEGNYLAYQNYGAALEKRGEFAGALGQYELAAKYNPLYSKNRVDMGNVLLQLNRIEEAENQLKLAIELDPQNSAAHNSLGVIFLARQNLHEAEALLRRSVELDPSNMQARGNLGAALLNLSKFDEAIEHLAAVKQSHSERVGVRTNLAVALANSGRIDEAIAELNSILLIAPNHAPARDILRQLNEQIR